MNMDLDLAAFQNFDGFGFYHFNLTRCGLELMILILTSSQVSVQLWDCTLLH